ncbi:hypothetical protein Sjap_011204 [Stephania japonica]|uniref:Uncharacterized protein n=1 Tax=Stephania japonica TaxID=461633 RepID=A0AAP0P4I7_9MAGN
MCLGVSDYGWSTPIILIMQIITVVVGSLAAALRWMIMLSDPPLHLRSTATELDCEMHFEVEIFSFQSLIYKRAAKEPVIRALDEAFELVYYIDKKINVENFQDVMKHGFAKALLAHKNVHLSKKDSSTRLHALVNEALSSIENEWNAFPDGLARKEIKIIMDFICVQEYASIEELCEDLEQLFVDMLLFFLPQLPIFIFKEVNESSIEVHEERARSSVRLLCKLKLLEDKVQWLFPEGCRVTKLMDPEELEGRVNDDQARNSENWALSTPVVLDQDGSASTIQVPNVSNPDVEYASIEKRDEDLEQLFVDMLLFFLPQLPIEVLEERARSIFQLLRKLKLLED